MKIPNKVVKGFDITLETGRMLGILMVFLSMMGLCAHVFMRYVFNFPLNWVVDISTMFIFFITFLGAPWLLREEGHVSLDVLTGVLSPRKWQLLQTFNSLLCAVVFMIIAVYGIKETIILKEMDIYVDMALSPPKWPLIAVIPVCSIAMSIQFIRRALLSFRTFKQLKTNVPPKH